MKDEQGLTINPEIPPPPYLRFDTVGIFAVLAFAGLAAVLNPTPNAVAYLAAEQYWIARLWEFTTMIFGVIGLASVLTARKHAIYGLAGEAVSRIVLGSSACIYAIGVVSYRGASGTFTALTFFGIAALMWIGAVQICRWLLKQRRVVTRHLRMMEER